jgi:hypothetical protein
MREMSIDIDNDNVTCPLFGVLQCADTDLHNHWKCFCMETMMSNRRAIDLCLQDWEQCEYFKECIKTREQESQN